MTIADELATEAMEQAIKALRSLPDDATPTERVKVIYEASKLLERTETKLWTVQRLGTPSTPPPSPA